MILHLNGRSSWAPQLRLRPSQLPGSPAWESCACAPLHRSGWGSLRWAGSTPMVLTKPNWNLSTETTNPDSDADRQYVKSGDPTACGIESILSASFQTYYWPVIPGSLRFSLLFYSIEFYSYVHHKVVDGEKPSKESPIMAILARSRSHTAFFIPSPRHGWKNFTLDFPLIRWVAGVVTPSSILQILQYCGSVYHVLH